MMYMHLSGSINFKLVIVVAVLAGISTIPAVTFGFSYQSWENAVQTRNGDV